MPLDLTDAELAAAEQPCRAMAYQEGERARKMENPTTRGPIENTAKRYAALAEKLEAARKHESPAARCCVTLVASSDRRISASELLVPAINKSAPLPTTTRATSTKLTRASAGTQFVEGTRGHEGTRRDSSRRGSQPGRFERLTKGLLFGNSLICLKAIEDSVGVSGHRPL
jgi:hypothetical protein